MRRLVRAGGVMSHDRGPGQVLSRPLYHARLTKGDQIQHPPPPAAWPPRCGPSRSLCRGLSCTPPTIRIKAPLTPLHWLIALTLLQNCGPKHSSITSSNQNHFLGYVKKISFTRYNNNLPAKRTLATITGPPLHPSSLNKYVA